MQRLMRASGLGIIVTGAFVTVGGPFLTSSPLSGMQLSLVVWFVLSGALVASRQSRAIWAYSVVVILTLLWSSVEVANGVAPRQVLPLMTLVTLTGIYLLFLWALGGFSVRPLGLDSIAPRTSAGTLVILVAAAAMSCVALLNGNIWTGSAISSELLLEIAPPGLLQIPNGSVSENFA
jgi:glucose dehydrogenase